MRFKNETGRLLTLEDLRSKVLFHNSIDVWKEYCAERGTPWNNTDRYGRFIGHLRRSSLNLKAFNLCAHEAGETEHDKKEFAESLASLKIRDDNYATYTIRLSGSAIDTIRSFE